MLLRAATQLMPPDSTLEVASIRGIPLYDADVEAQGFPPTVVQLKEAVVAADGVLLVTPEYNNSIPGVFKNAIDWLSRPPKDAPRVFGGKPVAILGATPGPGGTGPDGVVRRVKIGIEPLQDYHHLPGTNMVAEGDLVKPGQIVVTLTPRPRN